MIGSPYIVIRPSSVFTIPYPPLGQFPTSGSFTSLSPFSPDHSLHTTHQGNQSFTTPIPPMAAPHTPPYYTSDDPLPPKVTGMNTLPPQTLLLNEKSPHLVPTICPSTNLELMS